MNSVDGPGSKPQVQDVPQESPPEKPDAPVSGTHKFRKVEKMAANPTNGLKSRRSKKKPYSKAFEKLRAKIKPATKASQIKASELNAKAVADSRVFSKKELFAAAGAQFGQGKSLKTLGKMLDKYNAEVLSPYSTLTPAEKVLSTLKLREETKEFLAKKEHELSRTFKLHAQSKQRIMATHQLLGQIELLLPKVVGDDRSAYSRECCELLCDDIRNNGAQWLVELYQKPSLLQGMFGEMEYADVLHFADAQAQGRIEIADPEHVQALSRGVWQVLKRMDSDEIKHQVDTFNKEREGHFQETHVTGNSAYDRSRDFCTAMNMLLTENATAAELGISAYQCYLDGHLTMNMLDELVEEKANMMGRSFDEQHHADDAVAKLDKQTLASMHVARELPGFKPDVDSPKDVLWLGKVAQFDYVLKGDASGKDETYREFVRCWDEIRFKAMPEYNTRHNKEGLVDTNGIMSKELGKISPALLEELDQAKGNTEQVRVLLKKIGLRKAPDKLEFNIAMKLADRTDNPRRKARLQHLAVQDFLYRYFEERAGVEIPVIPPKPKSIHARKS